MCHACTNSSDYRNMQSMKPTNVCPYCPQHSLACREDNEKITFLLLRNFIPGIVDQPKHHDSLCLPEMNRARVTFSKSAHTARVRIGPPGTNHGPFTAKPSSCHVHRTLWVTQPHSAVPPFLLSHPFCWPRTRAPVCSKSISFVQCAMMLSKV